jgi:hypothetical protein
MAFLHLGLIVSHLLSQIGLRTLESQAGGSIPDGQETGIHLALPMAAVATGTPLCIGTILATVQRVYGTPLQVEVFTG